MKVEVLKEFADKETGVIYFPGSFFTGEKKRVDELVKLGFLKGEKEKTAKKAGK
jgi:hypothetical protein